MSLSNICGFSKTASENQLKNVREIWQTKYDAVLKKPHHILNRMRFFMSLMRIMGLHPKIVPLKPKIKAKSF